MRSNLGDYHLIRVGVHNQVRVVRDDDDLTPVLGFDKKADQLVEYRFRIEIFLGLVDDERAIVRFVEREIQQEQDYASRARRQLANVDAVIIDTVLNRDMIGPIQPFREAFRPFSVIGFLRLRNGCLVE